MSAIVANIVTESKTLIATLLGAGYQELQYIYDVSKNNVRVAKLGYGVRPLGASSAETVNRSYTMDQGFEFVLTDTIARGADDSGITTSIWTMLDKADEIFKALIQTKINLPLVVLNIFDPSLSEPEILDEKGFVVVRMQVLVKYRSALN